MATLTLNTEKIEYKGYSIEPDKYSTWRKDELIIYPTADGVDHDYDWNGDNWKYCGNCKWAFSIDEAKGIVDELIFDKIEMSNKIEEVIKFQLSLASSDDSKKEWETKLANHKKEQIELTGLIGNTNLNI